MSPTKSKEKQVSNLCRASSDRDDLLKEVKVIIHNMTDEQKRELLRTIKSTLTQTGLL